MKAWTRFLVTATVTALAAVGVIVLRGGLQGAAAGVGVAAGTAWLISLIRLAGSS